MNINDVKAIELDSGQDALETIFQTQRELMGKYHLIEKANGLLVTEEVPVNLHDHRGQFRLKDFAWRTTEELGEALEAFRIHEADHPEHYDEEVADALHFLTEFTILAGFGPEDIADRWIDLYDRLGSLYRQARKTSATSAVNSTRKYNTLCLRTGQFIEALAMTCNTLKNKPWKQSQMVTDTEYFKERLKEAWVRFIRLCITANINPQYLYDLYYRKSEVNKFRQRSNY